MARPKKLGRIVEMNLIKRVKDSPCFVCAKPGPNEHNFIWPPSLGGDDSVLNLWTLCKVHYCERMRFGIKLFADFYHLPVDFSGGYPRLNFNKETT